MKTVLEQSMELNEKFTDLETQVIESLVSQLYAEPGFSDVDAKDISRDITTLPTKIIRGVLGSLVKKGVITVDTNDSGYDIIYLNQSHWYLHPEWKKEVA